MKLFPSLLLIFLPLLGTSCSKNQASAPAAPPAAPAAIHLEAEQAALTGNAVLTKRAGFSGAGYVGDFEKEGAKIVWAVPKAAAGLYAVQIRYSAPFGDKGYDLVVNGRRLSGTLRATGDRFASQSGGKVELRAGANTVAVERGWGYYEVDAVDLVPAGPAPPPAAVSASPSDPQATPEARALLAALGRLYGDRTLSGQYGTPDNEYVRSLAGKTPAIMGGDFMDYSPSRLAHGSDPKGETERVIRAARAGQVVTMSWHWNAPAGLLDKMLVGKDGKPVDARWYKGFYTDATTFDIQEALADPKSADYARLLRDMDAVAAQLQKFSDAGVPVLWRPLHEAEQGAFWWGAKGPGPFKQLWRLMHDRLTNVHHLHNLIWVESSGTKPEWYPGDDVVDVVGVDEYPADTGDPLSGDWDTLMGQHGGHKIIALSEFGGVPDVEKMRRYGVRWSYFVSWSGDVGLHKMSKDDLVRFYHAPAVVTQDQLGALKIRAGH